MAEVDEKLLSSYELLFLETVLDELFAVLPVGLRTADDPPYPETVADLAKQVYQPAREIDRQLQGVVTLAAGVEISALHPDDVLVDLETLAPGELNDRFAKWQQATRVVVTANDDARAFSAAMFLRSNGILSAHFINRLAY